MATGATTQTWYRTSDARPRAGQRVDWITPSGEQVRGTYAGGLIWYPEGSTMYVYYTPERWRPANED